MTKALHAPAVWSRAAIALAAAFLLSGCATTAFRGPNAVVGSDVSELKVLSEQWRIDVGTGSDPLSGKAVIRAFKEMKVSESGIRLRREFGWYTPWNPLVEIVEYLSIPWLLGEGLARFYVWMTAEPEDGGVGRGWFSPEFHDALCAEDYTWVALSRDVDLVAREPDWDENFAFALDPTRNGRYVFPSRLCFGPIGPLLDGGRFTETRTERKPWQDAAVSVTVNGKAVEPANAGPGEFEIDLLSQGDGPVSVRVTARSPSGEPLSAGLDVAQGRLAEMKRASALAAELANDPSNAAKLSELEELRALNSPPAEAALAAERMALADPKAAAGLLDRIYGAAQSSAAASGNTAEALFIDALRDFHRDLLLKAEYDRELDSMEPRRIAIEAMASESFLMRARGALKISGMEGENPLYSTAALMALLRNERNPLTRWACYAGLEKCAARENAHVLGLIAAEEENPYVLARARAAVRAAQARP